MAKKILYALLSLIFALFAYWQLNDKDPMLWVPIYGGVSLLIGSHLFFNVPKMLRVAVLVAIGIGAAVYIPGVGGWCNEGMPSITGSMKAESPYIENMREFLGLILAGLALLGVHLSAK